MRRRPIRRCGASRGNRSLPWTRSIASNRSGSYRTLGATASRLQPDQPTVQQRGQCLCNFGLANARLTFEEQRSLFAKRQKQANSKAIGKHIIFPGHRFAHHPSLRGFDHCRPPLRPILLARQMIQLFDNKTKTVNIIFVSNCF